MKHETQDSHLCLHQKAIQRRHKRSLFSRFFYANVRTWRRKKSDFVADYNINEF